MNKKVLGFDVDVFSDLETGTNRKIFSAYCKSLKVYDFADTKDKVLKNITSGIKMVIRGIKKDGYINTSSIAIPKHRKPFGIKILRLLLKDTGITLKELLEFNDKN